MAKENQAATELLQRFDDVARSVKFPRSTIYGLIREGRFPAPIKVGKSSRWLTTELNTWIEQQAAKREGVAA